ncbi:MAG: bacterial transcriptional activator domain-containing protein [Oscillospiraceae bacterium]|nr:bacterial transcriptional activator domain-containing protein [Oscillospiraceae bacterium]
MADPIYVSMLGEFSIQRADKRIDDSTNRMRKVWLLLAYLIYTRKNLTTQEQLLSLTQGSSSSEAEDPAGRLKALFYRVRAMLDPLGPRAGHDLIQNKSGIYSWNTEIPLQLDVEEFDRLYTSAMVHSEDDRLVLLMEALSLYQGDFLPKLSMEAWVMPITAYYHQRYLEAADMALSLLCQRQRWQEALALCGSALKIEPYSEELYQYQMRCQIALNDRSGAIATYESMSELLFDTFGVMPSDESRSLYREASRESNDQHTVPAETVRESLQEPGSAKGAVFCEYDFFKLLYQVQARSIIRSGDVIHIALLSVHSANGQALPRRSLDRAMENLQSLVVSSLRQGDVITRCSASQLIVMLPQANYENGRLVCQRIIKAFSRQYPHSPAEIRFSVHPLEPTIPGSHHTKK